MEFVGRPDEVNRTDQAPDEEWRCSNRRYAVEHTRVEPFQRQIENLRDVERLLVPVKKALDGDLPGTFELAFPQNPRGDANVVVPEVVRLVWEAVERLAVGDACVLQSDVLRFELNLLYRDRGGSRLVLVSNISGDPEEMRFDRFRRAFDKKCGKLARWKGDGYTSVLILESNDIQHSNVFVCFAAVKHVLAGRNDHPDLIILVETEVSPMYAHVLKEHELLGDEVPQPNGVATYVEGEV